MIIYMRDLQSKQETMHSTLAFRTHPLVHGEFFPFLVGVFIFIFIFILFFNPHTLLSSPTFWVLPIFLGVSVKSYTHSLEPGAGQNLASSASCYGTASCLISSYFINHASPILSNELSNTSVWMLWNSSLFNLLHLIIVWSCGHYYKVWQLLGITPRC